MKTIHYLLPIVLFIGIQPVKADLGIPGELSCNGPFRYNGYPNDCFFSASISAFADAGILNAAPENPPTTPPPPPPEPQRKRYKLVSALESCGGLKNASEYASYFDTSPENNCGMASAATYVSEDITVNCDSNRVEIFLEDEFGFTGSGRLFLHCCESAPSLSGTVTGIDNQGTHDEVNGSVVFYIPSSVNSANIELKSALSCPSVSTAGVYFEGVLSARLRKMNSQGGFESISIQELVVDSSPDSPAPQAESLKFKGKLNSGIYMINVFYKAKASFGKTAYCLTDSSTPLDTEFGLEAYGSTKGNVSLTVTSFN